MGQLVYTATVSLDGYVADETGDFQWTAPDTDVFDLHVQRMADVAVEILGRNTYQLMTYWDTFDDETGTPAEWEFARRWQQIQKVVVSSTLTETDLASDRAQLVPQLSLEDVRQLVAETTGEVAIFGPTTAEPAIRAGIVDVLEFFIVPKVVGGGLRALPADVRLDLQLVEHRVFASGIAYARYERR